MLCRVHGIRTQRNIPPPPLQRGKSGAKGGCYPFKGGKGGSEALGKKQYLRWEGCKPDVTIVVHSHIHCYW